MGHIFSFSASNAVFECFCLHIFSVISEMYYRAQHIGNQHEILRFLMPILYFSNTFFLGPVTVFLKIALKILKKEDVFTLLLQVKPYFLPISSNHILIEIKCWTLKVSTAQVWSSRHMEDVLRPEDAHPNFIHAFNAYSPKGSQNMKVKKLSKMATTSVDGEFVTPIKLR